MLSYKGSDYGLVPEVEGENGKVRLLLPNPKSDDYRDANTNIVRTLHLQQMVQLPSLSHRSGLPNGATKPPNTYKKAVRQQPEGLRMRYRPFGDSEGSSSEDSNETAQFRVPTVIEAPHQSKASEHNIANDGDWDYRESPSRTSAIALETPKQSKKRKHDAVNGEKSDKRESVTKSKKRKTHKASSQEPNHRELPAVSEQINSLPEAAIDSPSRKSTKNNPTKTTIVIRSSPENPKKPQAHSDTPPPTTRDHPPEPKEPKAILREDKPWQNQPEKRSPKVTPTTHTSENPSTPAQPKPQRSNEEKRQRKEAKRRRHEARESALRKQENQLGTTSCEQPAPPKAEKKLAKQPKKEPHTKPKKPKRDALLDAGWGVENGYAEVEEMEWDQWGGALEDDMEACRNGDYHLIGGLYGDF